MQIGKCREKYSDFEFGRRLIEETDKLKYGLVIDRTPSWNDRNFRTSDTRMRQDESVFPGRPEQCAEGLKDANVDR